MTKLFFSYIAGDTTWMLQQPGSLQFVVIFSFSPGEFFFLYLQAPAELWDNVM